MGCCSTKIELDPTFLPSERRTDTSLYDSQIIRPNVKKVSIHPYISELSSNYKPGDTIENKKLKTDSTCETEYDIPKIDDDLMKDNEINEQSHKGIKENHEEKDNKDSSTSKCNNQSNVENFTNDNKKGSAQSNGEIFINNKDNHRKNVRIIKIKESDQYSNRSSNKSCKSDETSKKSYESDKTSKSVRLFSLKELKHNFKQDMNKMKRLPVTFGWKNKLFYYIFWMPDIDQVMVEFVEVNGIPLFDVKGRKSFGNYCKGQQWLNTSNKYFEMCNAVSTYKEKHLKSCIQSYKVDIYISDYFIDSCGIERRAYCMFGPLQHKVLKSFNFYYNSLNDDVKKHVKYPNSHLFSNDVIRTTNLPDNRRKKKD